MLGFQYRYFCSFIKKNMKSLLLSLLLIFSTSALAQKKNTKQQPLDSLVKNMTVQKGLITTYLDDENTLFFAIDQNLLDQDLLVVTRFAKMPANYSAYLNAGSKTAEQIVRFEKKGNTLYLNQISYTQQADSEDPIAQSVAENNFPPRLAAFPIKNTDSNQFLIDVSAHFMADSPGFNIIRKGDKDRYKIGGVDKKRSSIDNANSFPKNTEIRHTLTFSVGKPARSNRAKTLSFQINHSFIALPEEKMPIRYADERVGWFSLEKINYSSPKLKADDYRIIRRWRIEPKDPAAYAKGILVEPKKQIIYYLDPATPHKWRKYFKQGIEDWNSAFEKAGFKNVLVAKDPPSKEEDPNFSPEDVRYSTVRYVASTTRNAVGPSVSDPRTGEILESDIIWYHNHLRSYRNRYLLETAAANPKARTLDTPEEEIGEMMRRVIAHEVGHALGLPHNMKASNAYSVDSLRSGAFTQKYGIASTIMDYARYNYVAQPGDENIRFIRQMGPYDDYAIEWGYRFFNQSPKEEQELLSAMVDEKSLNPMYMFGGYGNDPQAQTENIGNDPIRASNYGLKNLSIVAKNLPKWTLKPGANFDDLEELFGELLSVYRRYIYHVHRIVGGVYHTRHTTRQSSVVTYENVPFEKQEAALSFLNTNLWKTQKWLMDKAWIGEFAEKGILSRIQNIQKSALKRLLDTEQLNRMHSSWATLPGKGMPVNTLLHRLSQDLCQNNTSNPDLFQRNLQLYFTTHLQSLLADEKLDPVIKTSIHYELRQLEKWAKRMKKTQNKVQKAHFDYLAQKLEDNKK